jgi:hypothetical protein
MSSSNLRLAPPRRGGKGRRWTRGAQGTHAVVGIVVYKAFLRTRELRGRARCGGRMKAGGAGRGGECSRVRRQHGRSGGGGNAISRGGIMGRRRQRRAGRAKSARGATEPSGDVWCLICTCNPACNSFIRCVRVRISRFSWHAGPAPLERVAHCSTNLSHSDQQDGSQITTKE